MKKIGIICKAGRPEPPEILGDFLPWLRDRGLEVFLDIETAGVMGIKGYQRAEIPSLCEMIVVLGGDGTMLSAARLASEKGIPLLGVNLGGLGFITEFYKDELYEAMETILRGQCPSEERLMLMAHIHRQGRQIAEYTALNDIVINKGALARVIDFDTHIDKSFVTGFKADGLIVSTPTGSTAYCLSAGGPILYPTLHNIVLTPICPHTLTNRPIVLPDEVHIEIILKSGSDVFLTMDGQVGFPLIENDVVEIKKSPFRTVFLVPCEKDYFQVLRTKLKWGSYDPFK